MKWKFRAAAVAGNALEFYDIAVFGAISGYLALEFERQGYTQGQYMVWGIFALRFLVRPLGGYLIGRYADRVGRKPALILTSCITGLATLSMALLPVSLLGPYTPLALLILQMALALSFGGEYPTLITYLFSDAQRHHRARISALIVSSSIMGVLVSLLIVYTLAISLTPDIMQSVGWRIPLLVGVLNIIISFWFRARLPTQLVQPTQPVKIQKMNMLHVFLITVPGAVIFYVQNMSSTLLMKALYLPYFKGLYPMISSGLLLVSLAICGWLTDKYATPSKVFNLGVTLLVILSVPLYFILNSKTMELILLAQFIITLNAAMILCNLAAVLFDASRGHTTTLGMGYNISLSLFGGLTPLVISYLISYSVIYAGIYISLSGLALLLSYLINKHQQRLSH
ncbi:MFS transporter [Yersinia mollaretii]|uniref:MFS transporter n=1 Tax=Yersinia mollaretii TaxID=33060 RepID=UPI0011A859B6|nr:MFS transporter [Yersinia mollaretii]